MPKTFDVPGVGKLDFPDDATPQEIQTFLDENYNKPKPSPVESGLRSFATSILPTGAGMTAAAPLMPWATAAAAPTYGLSYLVPLAVGGLASWGAGELQDPLLKKAFPGLEEQQRADAEQNKFSSAIGRGLAVAPFAEFAPGQTLKALAGLPKAFMGNKEALKAAGGVALNVGLQEAITAGQTLAGPEHRLPTGLEAGEAAFIGGAYGKMRGPLGRIAEGKAKAPPVRPEADPAIRQERERAVAKAAADEGITLKMVDQTPNPKDVAYTADDGSMVLNRNNFHTQLEQNLVKGKTVEQAISSLISEEKIHSVLKTMKGGDEKVMEYWNALTSAEKGIERRRYQGPGGTVRTDLQLAHESVRFELQRLKDMTPGEYLFYTSSEVRSSKFLTMMEDIIKWIRGIFGTKANARQKELLGEFQEKLDLAKEGVKNASENAQAATVHGPVQPPSGEGARPVSAEEGRARVQPSAQEVARQEKILLKQVITPPNRPLKGELIEEAAYVHDDGSVHYGPHHPAAAEKAGGAELRAKYPTRESREAPQTIRFGYKTNRRPFVSRELGTKISEASGQDLRTWEEKAEGVPSHTDTTQAPRGEGTVADQPDKGTPATAPATLNEKNPYAGQLFAARNAVQTMERAAAKNPKFAPELEKVRAKLAEVQKFYDVAEKAPPAAQTGRAQPGQAPTGGQAPAGAATPAGPAATHPITTPTSPVKPQQLAELEAKMNAPGYDPSIEDMQMREQLMSEWSQRQREAARAARAQRQAAVSAQGRAPAMTLKGGEPTEEVRRYAKSMMAAEKSDTGEANRVGMQVKNMADLDALLAADQHMKEQMRAARAAKNFQEAFRWSGVQFPREAIETAINFGSNNEAMQVSKGRPLGERPLDWKKHPEVAQWLLDNAEKLGLHKHEELQQVRDSLAGKPAMTLKGPTADMEEIRAGLLAAVPPEMVGDPAEHQAIIDKYSHYIAANVPRAQWQEAFTVVQQEVNRALDIVANRSIKEAQVPEEVNAERVARQKQLEEIRRLNPDKRILDLDSIYEQMGEPTMAAMNRGMLFHLNDKITEYIVESKEWEAFVAEAAKANPEITEQELLDKWAAQPRPKLQRSGDPESKAQQIYYKYPDYNTIWRDIHKASPSFPEEVYRRLWQENVDLVLSNASRARLEEWRKAARLDKKEHRGFIPEPDVDRFLTALERATRPLPSPGTPEWETVKKTAKRMSEKEGRDVTTDDVLSRMRVERDRAPQEMKAFARSRDMTINDAFELLYKNRADLLEEQRQQGIMARGGLPTKTIARTEKLSGGTMKGKEIGFTSVELPRDPMTDAEIRAFDRNYREAEKINKRRREKLVGALRDWLVKPSLRPERDPMRLKISTDEIDQYRTFSPSQQADYKFLNAELAPRGTSVKGKTASKLTRALALVIDRETGQHDLVSVYRDPKTKEVKLYEPSSYRTDDKTQEHITLREAMALYQIKAGILLDDPVYRFHQRWEGKDAGELYAKELGEYGSSIEEGAGLAWKQYNEKLKKREIAQREEEHQKRFGTWEQAVKEGRAGEPEPVEPARGEIELGKRMGIGSQEAYEAAREGTEPPLTAVERAEGNMFVGPHSNVLRVGAGLLQTDVNRMIRGPMTTVEAEALAKVFNREEVLFHEMAKAGKMIEYPEGTVKAPPRMYGMTVDSVASIEKILDRINHRRQHMDFVTGERWGLRGEDYAAVSALDKMARFYYLKMARDPALPYRKQLADFANIPKHNDLSAMTEGQKAYWHYRENLKYKALKLAFEHIYELVNEARLAPPEKGERGLPIRPSAFREAALAVYGEKSRSSVEAATASQERPPAESGQRSLLAGSKYGGAPRAISPILSHSLRPGRETMLGGPPFQRKQPPFPFQAEEIPRPEPSKPGPPFESAFTSPIARKGEEVPERRMGEYLRRTYAAQTGRDPFIPKGPEGFPPGRNLLREPGTEQLMMRKIAEQSRGFDPNAPAMTLKGDYGISQEVRKEMIKAGRAIPVEDWARHMSDADLVNLGKVLVTKRGVNSTDTMAKVESGEESPRMPEDLSVVRYEGMLKQQFADLVAEKKGLKSKEYDLAEKNAAQWQAKIQTYFGTPTGQSLRLFGLITDAETGSVTTMRQKLREELGRDISMEEGERVVKKAKESKAAQDATKKAMDAYGKDVSQGSPLGDVEKQKADQILSTMQQRADDALNRLTKNKPPSMAMKADKVTPLTQQEIVDLSEIGANVMSQLSAKGDYTDAMWWDEMRKLIGDGYKAHRDAILSASEKWRDVIINEAVGGGDATAGIRSHLTRKTPSVEESKAAIKRAISLDPHPRKISTSEAFHVWNYIRQRYLKEGIRDIREISTMAGQDIGLSFDRMFEALATKRSTKKLGDEMLLRMRDEMRVTNQAKNWLKNQKYPEWLRFVRKVPRWFFADKIFGHGFVPMITHAGNMMFDPSSSKVYFEAWRDMYKMAFSPTEHTKIMESLRTDKHFNMWRKAGLQADPFHYSDDYQIEGLWKFFQGALGARGFDALKTLRFARAEQWWNVLPDHLKTDEMAVLIAESVNHATGIVKTRFHESLNWLMFAPKLEASRWAFIFKDPIKAANYLAHPKTSSPVQMHWAQTILRQRAVQVGMYYGILALSQQFLKAAGSKQTINITDPSQADFMQMKVPGYRIGVVSPMIGMVRMLANMIHAGQGDLRPLEKLKSRQDLMSEVAGKYIRGKMSPFASFATDIASQQDFTGRPLPWSSDKLPLYRRRQGIEAYEPYEWLATQFLPIPAEEVVREMWAGLGMGETEIEKNLRALSVGVIMGGTGARVAQDE